MGLARRIGNLFRRSQVDREISAELEAHITLMTEANIAAGMTPDEARRDARVRFGNPVAMKEQAAGADAALSLDSFWFDVRYAMRQLKRSPGFALTAIVTLAVAIGANSVVFSVLNAVVLRPLDLPGGRSLYMIENRGELMNSYPDYRDLRDRNKAFDGTAIYNFNTSGMYTGGQSQQVFLYEASGNYFDVLGVEPMLGRFFHSSDEHGLDTVPYVVLSYDFWRLRFHGDANVIGQTIELNRHEFTILGVARPKFRGSELLFAPDMWVPLVDQAQIEGFSNLANRNDESLWMIGRMKPGLSVAQGENDLNTIGADLKKTYPREDDGTHFTLTRPGLAGNMLGGPVRAFVLGLMLLAGLILLAACANLGSLFAARGADRAGEVAMRVALGSTRGRILRQVLTEALLISIAGGAAGIAGSVVLLRALTALRPIPQFPVSVPVNPDATTYAMAVALALLSGLLCGLAPMRQIFRTSPWEVVKARTAAPRGRWRFAVRDVLLVVQVAVCAVLMTASLAAVRGLERSMHASFGFEPDHAVVLSTDLVMAGYQDDRVPAMQRRMIDTAAAMPGVIAAGEINFIPLGLGWSITPVFADGTTDFRPSNAAAQTLHYQISPGYFQAAGTTLLAGRDITWNDKADTPKVVVINRYLAQKLFGSATAAIGQHLMQDEGRSRLQVIGVVEDGKYMTLAEEQKAAYFAPLLQDPTTSTWLVTRTSGDAASVAANLGDAVRGLDSSLPFQLSTWNRSLDGALFAARAATVSLGALGLLGAMLAMTGIFGMASYSVSKRLKEMGIRMALGADRVQMLRAVLGPAFRLLAVGSLAGLLLGIAASRVLSFIVYQATPHDPLVLTGAVLAMLLVGMAATWAPAQRAMHVRLAQLLREE
jgi:predicted permease